MGNDKKVKGLFKCLKIKAKIKIVLNKLWFKKKGICRNIISKHAKVNIKNKNRVWEIKKNE